MEWYFSAFVIGLLGSLHCVGMCGPIALALPVSNMSFPGKLFGIFSYNLGRIFTYSTIGACFGLFGQGLALAGYQQAVSIVMGVIILVGLAITYFNIKNPLNISFVYHVVSKLKNIFRHLLGKHSVSAFFLAGLANGFLPCGLVYLGITGSVVSSHWYNGALFMAFFGVGTLPAMYSLPFIGSIFSLRMRNNIKKMMPLFVSLVAVLMIVRGLNLGIPFISPGVSDTNCTKMQCCHK